MCKNPWFSVVLAVVSTLWVDLRAQTTNAYFIGNSFTYTYDVPGTLRDLSAAGGHSLQTGADLIGGSELADHWLTGVATNAISAVHYNLVILQENSGLSYTPSIQSNFDIYAPLYNAVITNSGAKTLLYMTWVRESQLASLQACINIYRNMADQLGCKISPVGEAWKRLLAQYPAIDPYGPDRHHPSPEGAYLSACCFYGAIYGETPEGLAVASAGGTAFDAGDAAILQRIAWDAVQSVTFTNPPVISSLTVDQTVRTNTEAFVFQVVASGGGVVDYQWNFGDGTLTNGAALDSVEHAYAADGVYPVTVTVTGANSETDRSGLSVTRDILGPQVPDFTADPTSGDIPLTVAFTDNSTGIITNRFWDFGDGTTTNAAEASVFHTYTTAGFRTVRLVVQGSAVAVTNTQADVIHAIYTPTVIAAASTADRYITESSPLAFRGETDLTGRVGDNSSGQRYTYVIPFPLPEPPGGDPVSDVKLHVRVESKTSFSSATNIYIDILGGRVSSVATVTDADVTGTTAVLLGSAQMVNKNVIVPFDATYSLSPAFFRSIYESDPAAVGKFVFITLRAQTVDPIASNSYLVYTSANSASNTPVLEITTAPSGTDDDSDGIPNDWETQYFGGSTNANPNALAANGHNTIREAYIAGLNPTNAQSVFAVSNDWKTLHWNAVSGRIYSVYWSTNLIDGFQPLETNIVWPQSSWTGQVDGAQGGTFYQLKVGLTP